jgi:hypothetical protein
MVDCACLISLLGIGVIEDDGPPEVTGSAETSAGMQSPITMEAIPIAFAIIAASLAVSGSRTKVVNC